MGEPRRECLAASGSICTLTEFQKAAPGTRQGTGALGSQPAWEQALTRHSLTRGTWEGPGVSIRLSSSSCFARQTKHTLTNKKLNPRSSVAHGGSAMGLGYCAQSPKVPAPPIGGSAFIEALWIYDVLSIPLVDGRRDARSRV